MCLWDCEVVRLGAILGVVGGLLGLLVVTVVGQKRVA